MIMRIVDNPYCNQCHGAYETATHFVGEYDRYVSLSSLSLSILTAFFQVNLFIEAKDGGTS